jgi:hypothetical protein
MNAVFVSGKSAKFLSRSGRTHPETIYKFTITHDRLFHVSDVGGGDADIAIVVVYNGWLLPYTNLLTPVAVVA